MAMLAGLPQAPSRYSPLRHYEEARVRQRYVLNRMVVDGYISADQARQAFAEGVEIYKSSSSDEIELGYYLSNVKKRAKALVPSAYWRSGLRIHTFFDPLQQRAASVALRDGTRAVAGRQALVPDGTGQEAAPQGALVSMDACSSR
ncbi:unnamed protein product, partial [Cyprideis torosa]